MKSRVEGRTPSRDGLSLFWRGRLAERPRAALVLVHGLCEHSGRYARPLGYFGEDYACYAVDLRGHGLSAGPRGHVDGFDAYLDDVEAALGVARQAHPGLAAFVIGHSMGGLVALLMGLLRPAVGLAGVIANAPALRTHPALAPHPAVQALARLAAPLLPRLRRPTVIEPTLLTRDPEVIAAYASDPLVSRHVSLRWFTSYNEAQRQAWAEVSRLRIPSLVMASGEDRLVDSAAVADWAARAPEGLVSAVRWPGLYHEAFNEPEQERVFERVRAFVEERLAARQT